MRYALLLCEDENAAPSLEERPAQLAAFRAVIEDLTARGVLLSRARLRPTTTATTVQVRNGDVVIADGPFVETREQIGGFFLVECTDLDEAIAVAAQIPIAQSGTIEVRPVWEIE